MGKKEKLISRLKTYPGNNLLNYQIKQLIEQLEQEELI